MCIFSFSWTIFYTCKSYASRLLRFNVIKLSTVLLFWQESDAHYFVTASMLNLGLLTWSSAFLQPPAPHRRQNKTCSRQLFSPPRYHPKNDELDNGQNGRPLGLPAGILARTGCGSCSIRRWDSCSRRRGSGSPQAEGTPRPGEFLAGWGSVSALSPSFPP